MAKKKDEKKNKELVTQLINVVLAFVGAVATAIAIGCFWDTFYANFETVVIKDIMSGILTGTPDGHVYFILYPLSAFLALLYRIIPAVNWFGVLLTGINAWTVYLFVRRVQTYSHKVYFKVLTVVISVVAFEAALIRYSIFYDYKVSGAIAIALGIFAYMTIKDTLKLPIFLLKCIPSIILFYIGYCLNQEAFNISIPMLVIACVIKAANGALKKKAKKNNKDSLLLILIQNDSLYKYLLVPVVTAIMVLLCFVIDESAYKSEEWNDYDVFYDNLLTVYEIQGGIPSYADDRDLYDLYEIDENEFYLLEDKNFALMDDFDPEILEAIKEDNAQKFDHPYEVTYSDAVNLYFEGVNFFNEGYLMVGLILMYLFLFVAAIIAEKKRFVAGATAIFFARNICGVFAYMTGVNMKTNVIALAIVESFVLAGNIILITPYLTLVKKNSGKSKKIIGLVTRIVIVTLCSLTVVPLVINTKRIKEEYKEFIDFSEFYNNLAQYFMENSDTIYVCDTNSVDSYSERVYGKRENLKNYYTAGGFVSQMPLYKDRLAAGEMNNLTEDLLKENVNWVTENTNNIIWLEGYYDTLGQAIDATEQDMLKATLDTKYVIYSVTPYVFGDEFLEGGYDTFFLAQNCAESFDTSKFNEFLGCNIYSTDETQSLRKIVKMAKTALAVKPDMTSVWIELDPFNYDFCNESIDTTNEIYAMENILLDNPSVTFNFLFNFPAEKAWNENEALIGLKLQSYRKAYSALSSYANSYFELPGSTNWVLKNNAINDGQDIASDVTSEIVAEWICRTYAVDEENIDERLEFISSVCNECRQTSYADLSDKKVVFFGDSIIANYTTTSGVEAATASLCHIQTDNQAVGGTTATYNFIEATSEYFAETPANGNIYVINYGFNDFLQGISTNGGTSYKSGLMAGIDKIRENDADAKIIIVSPYFSDGTSAVEGGPSMPEYVTAAQEAAAEKGCYFINNYDELGINAENVPVYQCGDHVHLNQEGRIKYAEILSRHLTEWFAN